MLKKLSSCIREYKKDSKGSVIKYPSSTSITASMNNKTFTPYYISAGYVPLKASDDSSDTGSIPFMEQVFIPGNYNPDSISKVHPFPYTNAGLPKNTIRLNFFSSSSIPALHNDNIEKNLIVPNLYVMDEFMTSELYNLIKNDPSTSAYKITADHAVTDDSTIMRYLSSIDAKVIANMLTAYYNAHHDKKLEFVYYCYTSNTGISPAVEGSLTTVLSDATLTYATRTTIANNSNYIIEKSGANGFRLLDAHEWEYCARIITDERQLPLESVYSNIPTPYPLDTDDAIYSTVIKPTQENGLKHYFQSARGAVYPDNKNKVSYFGSGAGLAYHDGTSYNPQRLRTTLEANAIRAQDGSDTNALSTIYDICKTNNSRSVEKDYNRRNGAGLWGMTLTFWNIVNDCSYCGRDVYYTALGGSYSTTDLNSASFGFGTIGSVGVTTASGQSAALRLCRLAE